MPQDVPSPIDLRHMADAAAWADTAMLKRPWRTEFFACMASAIQARSRGQRIRILELGSGPGFLAHHLLTALPQAEYVALDFSAAMHELARQRMGPLAARVRFIERDFLDPAWTAGLGPFDHVVTMQAIHELRHKHRAAQLHAQVKTVLEPEGLYLACDHHAGPEGMADTALFMTPEEQQTALRDGGFPFTLALMRQGSLMLWQAAAERSITDE